MSLRPLDGPIAIIRTDSAPGFQALVNDPFLQENRLCIELGRVKNINKNPTAERAIQELETEIVRQDPSGGPISSPTTLSSSSSVKFPNTQSWPVIKRDANPARPIYQ